MNALLRRAQPPRDVLGYADLTLDLTARTVRRGDAELSFTRIEFSLLELLVRNAEQVLGYDVIMDRVWGYGEAPASNALQVFVAFLRRKLEAEGRPAPGAQRARRRVRAAGRPVRIRLTLKARFILVAGGAVAAVALAITAVAFLAIRTDLQNQVRQEVAAPGRQRQCTRHAQYHGHIPDGWVPAALERRVREPHLHAGRHVRRPGLGPAGRPAGCSRRARPPSRWRRATRTRSTPSPGSTTSGRWCSPSRSAPASPSRWPRR